MYEILMMFETKKMKLFYIIKTYKYWNFYEHPLKIGRWKKKELVKIGRWKKKKISITQDKQIKERWKEFQYPQSIQNKKSNIQIARYQRYQ